MFMLKRNYQPSVQGMKQIQRHRKFNLKETLEDQYTNHRPVQEKKTAWGSGYEYKLKCQIQFSSVSSVAQSCPTLCDPMDCSTPGLPVHHQFRSLHKPMSIESVMPSNHLILYCPLLLLPSIFPSIRVFSNGSALRIRWPKYWSFSFNSSPSNEHLGLISFRMNWLDLLPVKGLSRVFSNTTVQKHQLFCTQLSSQSNSHIHT